MDSRIIIQELSAPNDVKRFWEALHAYFRRDIFPDPEDEDRDYFLGDEYRSDIERLRRREKDPVRFLSFRLDGQEVGFASAVVYSSEDGKCFIMEFCVLPAFRGGGTGRACAAALLDWGRKEGAAYFELNAAGDRQGRFWRRVGFLPNGADEWGVPLMLLPPEERLPFAVKTLADPDDPALGWQLHKLENGYLAEIGEGELDDEKKARLAQAIRAGRITFFLAMRGTRAVGMCSAAPCFSTFSCGEVGVFDDFFVEPAFRTQGVARLLVRAAQDWCVQRGIASFTVCCAPCDEGMYRALGFQTPLGSTFAWLGE